MCHVYSEDEGQTSRSTAAKQNISEFVIIINMMIL
jgi:hypothetical protein